VSCQLTAACMPTRSSRYSRSTAASSSRSTFSSRMSSAPSVHSFEAKNGQSKHVSLATMSLVVMTHCTAHHQQLQKYPLVQDVLCTLCAVSQAIVCFYMKMLKMCIGHLLRTAHRTFFERQNVGIVS